MQCKTYMWIGEAKPKVDIKLSDLVISQWKLWILIPEQRKIKGYRCESGIAFFVWMLIQHFYSCSVLISLWLQISYKISEPTFVQWDHPCMPSPLAPDQISVRSCVCGLFWTNRNSMAVTSISLIYLAHYPMRDKSLYQGYNSKWKYLLLLKL